MGIGHQPLAGGGLLGAALDNLADATVCVVSLYAVGRSLGAQTRAARISGILLIVLGIALLVEVVRRFFRGSEPIGAAMMVTALVNAAAKGLCLRLLRSHRKSGVPSRHLGSSRATTCSPI